MIAEALKPSYDAQALRGRVAALAAKHPLYPGLSFPTLFVRTDIRGIAHTGSVGAVPRSVPRASRALPVPPSPGGQRRPSHA
ncbi:hypothetical protein SALBM217S_02659 [Streptomyces griseoloalbus]